MSCSSRSQRLAQTSRSRGCIDESWDHVDREPLIRLNPALDVLPHSPGGDRIDRPPRALSCLSFECCSLACMLGGESGQVWGGGHSRLGACILYWTTSTLGCTPMGSSHPGPAAHGTRSDPEADLSDPFFAAMRVRHISCSMHQVLFFVGLENGLGLRNDLGGWRREIGGG